MPNAPFPVLRRQLSDPEQLVRHPNDSRLRRGL
jgi:hypothetical protein